MTELEHGFVSEPDAGETYWTGFPNTLRLTGEDTGGSMVLNVMRVPPGAVTPPHIHHNEHQTDHVVEGEMIFTVDGERIVADAGTVVHGPKGVPHSFRNESDRAALVYDWLHPAGFDDFMREAAEPLDDPSNPPELDMDRVVEVAADHGLEFLDPEEDGPDR